MRWKAVLLVLFTVFFAGCSNASNPIDNAVSLRNQILTSDSCSFRITVNADYGTAVYTFSMDCTSDKEGNLSFCVTAPETIAGITGNISSQGGAITFEDKIYGPDFEPVMELCCKYGAAPTFICESAGTQAEDAKAMKDYYWSVKNA